MSAVIFNTMDAEFKFDPKEVKELIDGKIIFDNYYTVCGCNPGPFSYYVKDHKAL